MSSKIKKCMITKAGTDDNDRRIQQYTANGSEDDAEIWAPYGMSYNLPEDCLCLHIQLSEDEGDVVILPDRSKDRVKDLKRGENAFFNPLTKTRTINRLNGDMEIVTAGENGDMLVTIKKDWTVVVGGNVNLTVEGDVIGKVTGKVDLDITGDCDVKAANVNVDAATTNLGVGGPEIARKGDAVQVTVIGGSSAGTHNGTITGGGVNTSI